MAKRFDDLDPALAAIAADLADLPRAEFKENLHRKLQKEAESMASMAPKVNFLPPGYHTATPYLIVDNAAAAIDFYRNAFGAAEVLRMQQPDGKIGHAEIKIGDSHIMLADEHPEIDARSPAHYGGSPVSMLLYFENVDATFAQAVAAGAQVLRPLRDQPYGDRSGVVQDPFGHKWVIATHIRDVSAAELERMAQQPAPPPQRTWIPEGFRSVTPYLQVKGAAELIDFLKQAFDAQEMFRVPRPDGSVMHAQLRIGDSPLELADGNAQYKPSPVGLHMYVPDADAVYRRALEAGAVSLAAPVDQPYGDREAGVRDPSGNSWWIATHKTGSYIPEGMPVMMPFLHPKGAPKLIEFLERAFGAEVASRHEGDDGTVHHAAVRIGDAIIEMGEAHGEFQPAPFSLHYYVPDVDAVYRTALAAGGASLSEPTDQPYGERSAGVRDPAGNAWYIATRTSG